MPPEKSGGIFVDVKIKPTGFGRMFLNLYYDKF